MPSGWQENRAVDFVSRCSCLVFAWLAPEACVKPMKSCLQSVFTHEWACAFALKRTHDTVHPAIPAPPKPVASCEGKELFWWRANCFDVPADSSVAVATPICSYCTVLRCTGAHLKPFWSSCIQNILRECRPVSLQQTGMTLSLSLFYCFWK